MQFQTLANFRLTEDEFEQIASKKKMMERSLQVAREIVVEGRGVTEAAEQAGMSKQQALEIKKRIYAVYLENLIVPPDWVKAPVCAPQDMLDRFLAEVEQERIKYFAQKG
ncbi:transcriptional regulator [Xanthomonas phaseoli pv. dieffenbachiae]|uniref:TrfB-related DNA-binding protein n=1 Tax=Xanthomonas TaxID=338 RepID=UPI0006E6921E|nr:MULTISPECIES: TrfB-related DNA-binding protein [Xanthomonas]MBO9746790.1 transcriptional regulator [Xanthomonas phaseoli pv. dieffenbachiae]MBO9753550.1 transcriptional regulator [Xanthomonas phaseoli pv. dieffenbachiae]MBO9891676.1 transcriptional regulator [Xanthomonas sp. D-36-1]OQP70527.1 transcriptional regulator [Xanthomonas citri]